MTCAVTRTGWCHAISETKYDRPVSVGCNAGPVGLGGADDRRCGPDADGGYTSGSARARAGVFGQRVDGGGGNADAGS